MLTNNTTARTTVKPLSHFKYVFLYALYRGINHVTLHVGFGTGNVPRRLIPSHHHPRRRPLRCRTPWQMPTPGPSQGGVIVARHPNDTTSTTTNHRQHEHTRPSSTSPPRHRATRTPAGPATACQVSQPTILACHVTAHSNMTTPSTLVASSLATSSPATSTTTHRAPPRRVRHINVDRATSMPTARPPQRRRGTRGGGGGGRTTGTGRRESRRPQQRPRWRTPRQRPRRLQAASMRVTTQATSTATSTAGTTMPATTMPSRDDASHVNGHVDGGERHPAPLTA